MCRHMSRLVDIHCSNNITFVLPTPLLLTSSCAQTTRQRQCFPANCSVLPGKECVPFSFERARGGGNILRSFGPRAITGPLEARQITGLTFVLLFVINRLAGSRSNDVAEVSRQHKGKKTGWIGDHDE
ncbi:hypothetical protein JTE90_011868 [Oedothorax gibbosus]|uniref:Uncharacterized protein n=1 Tax=Oedothorax gibbosus TaxID=931172 RepID=A0AAV6V5H3_9ARAC|nr:hypothetical protein JTE90_011868 [Oedothorax gibbosus]